MQRVEQLSLFDADNVIPQFDINYRYYFVALNGNVTRMLDHNYLRDIEAYKPYYERLEKLYYKRYEMGNVREEPVFTQEEIIALSAKERAMVL